MDPWKTLWSWVRNWAFQVLYKRIDLHLYVTAIDELVPFNLKIVWIAGLKLTAKSTRWTYRNPNATQMWRVHTCIEIINPKTTNWGCSGLCSCFEKSIILRNGIEILLPWFSQTYRNSRIWFFQALAKFYNHKSLWPTCVRWQSTWLLTVLKQALGHSAQFSNTYSEIRLGFQIPSISQYPKSHWTANFQYTQECKTCHAQIELTIESRSCVLAWVLM